MLICLPLIGILAGYVLMARPVTITVDGETSQVTTRALTVRGALRSAGIQLNPLDQVSPPAGSWLSKTTEIVLDRSRLVIIWVDPFGKLVEVNTSAKTPAGILSAAGITAAADDLTRIDGKPAALDETIPVSGALTLQYTPAIPLVLNLNGQPMTVRTTSSTVGQALWNANVQIRGGDALSLPFNTLITSASEVRVVRSVPLEISADGKTITTYAAADTVGEALARSGVTLQDLDYSQPIESEPLPADGKIQVVRVKEEIILQQKSVPYDTQFIADPDLELDQRKVVEPGSYGIQAARVRVRYENGVETSRKAEDTVTLKNPVTRVETYGTKIVLRTIDTPNGPMTYYRALTARVTSYSPCNSGVDKCYPSTAMGIPVKKGVLAVHLDWYRLLKGSKMYIPGYGVGIVADTGVYPYNHNWVDAGYTDAEFAAGGVVNGTFTVYFLAPFPATEPWILP
ncbi:MAG: hypothetical protein C0401_03565 [Anaerolinea sp.]|nr:hypothetical protein [Anaerolinea sp.]